MIKKSLNFSIKKFYSEKSKDSHNYFYNFQLKENILYYNY